jgi:hypothetical protein
VHWNPSKFDAPSNATSCLVLALGLGLGSAINTAIKSNGTNSANILFAVAMANIVLILKATSVLAKKRAKVEAKYSARITLFIIATPILFAYALQRPSGDVFHHLCILLCAQQSIYIFAIAAAVNGSHPEWCLAQFCRKRRVYWSLSGILGVQSVAYMMYAGFELNVDLTCNWEWNEGQVSPINLLQSSFVSLCSIPDI